MRNKRLHKLQEDAEKSFTALSDYLKHLDKRETDPSYVHARMLFDEGWRMHFKFGARFLDDHRPCCSLWMDVEDNESPALIIKSNLNDPEIHQALGVTEIGSSVEIVKFLLELSDEDGAIPPDLKGSYGYGGDS